MILRILMLFLFFMGLNSTAQENCITINNIEKLPTELLIAKADSVSTIKKEIWKEKEKLDQQGILVDIGFESNIYFEQNCFETINLEFAHILAGMMIINKSLEVKIIGNLDIFELTSRPDLSIKRAEYIRDVLIVNGVEENRIEIFDAKSDRPFVPQNVKGRKENRRVDFEILN